MIEPKEVTVSGIDGVEKVFIISKLPALVGREVVATYPTSAIPKLGEYSVNEAIMLKMMGYVSAVSPEGAEVALRSKDLVNNHCADWQVLAKLEMAMLEYNTSFFGNGKVSKLLDDFAKKAPVWITRILTDLSGQLSQAAKQASTSSKPSTRSKTRS